MHDVQVNRLGGLSLPRKSVVRLTDRPDMTLDVYRGRKTTIQQQLSQLFYDKDSFSQNLPMSRQTVTHYKEILPLILTNYHVCTISRTDFLTILVVQTKFIFS